MIIPIGYKPDITMIIDYNNQYKTDFNVCVKNFSYKSQIEEYAVATAIVAKCISNYKRKKQLIELHQNQSFIQTLMLLLQELPRLLQPS